MDCLELPGFRVAFREEGSGDPMILVHGWTGSSYDWNRLIPLLSQQYRVAAPDLPGFGLSNKPRIDYSIDAYTALISSFADALGMDRFHLAGNSMGGHISAAFALRHPARVKSLTLVDSAGVSEGAPWIFKAGRWPGLVYLLLRFTPLFVFNIYYRRAGPYHDSSFLTPEDIKGHYHSYGNAEGAYAAARCLKNIIHDPAAQLDDRLGEIKVPTLVVWGEFDPMLSKRMGRAMQSRIPDADMAVIPGAGHCPQEEKPEDLARLLIDFTASVNSDR